MDEHNRGDEASVVRASAPVAANGTAPVQTGNGAAVVPGAATKQYQASIYPGSQADLPPAFVTAIRQLEASLGMPVWFIIQGDQGEGGDVLRPPALRTIDATLAECFYAASKTTLAADTPIALLLHSPGGSAREAYRLGSLLQRHCGGYTAVVPRWAKSAATLLCLGATRILLGRQGELGPLDAQIFDPDHVSYRSALNEYQSLARLQVSALEAIEQAVAVWQSRSLKRFDRSRLLPLANTFVAEMMRPLFEKIDTVHYSETARILKEGEEYALRLLAANYRADQAAALANALVENYPAHDFVIDVAEAHRIARADGRGVVGLHLQDATEAQEALFDQLDPFLDGTTLIGRVEEAQGERTGGGGGLLDPLLLERLAAARRERGTAPPPTTPRDAGDAGEPARATP